MGQSAKPTRQNRTITVDFQELSTYVQMMNDGKAFEFILIQLSVASVRGASGNDGGRRSTPSVRATRPHRRKRGAATRPQSP
jgi:hypothetical protein